MQVHHCTAVPLVKVSFVVDRVVIARGDTHVEGEGFRVDLPSSTAKKVSRGDTLRVLCVPNGFLTSTLETLSVSIQKKDSGVTRPLYGTSKFWNSIHNLHNR